MFGARELLAWLPIVTGHEAKLMNSVESVETQNSVESVETQRRKARIASERSTQLFIDQLCPDIAQLGHIPNLDDSAVEVPRAQQGVGIRRAAYEPMVDRARGARGLLTLRLAGTPER